METNNTNRVVEGNKGTERKTWRAPEMTRTVEMPVISMEQLVYGKVAS